MREAKLLGTLLPSHPDLQLIIEAVREKYGLPEISSDDDPIKEIYIGDEFVTLEVFRQELRSRILDNLESIAPEDFNKKYKSAKAGIEANYQKELELLPESLRPAMETFFTFVKSSMQTIFQILDAQIDSMTKMLYIYLLTGETEEAPDDWFGKVATMNTGGAIVVFAMASEITDMDALIQQFRAEHKKKFSKRVHKITDKTVSTAHYLMLKKMKKPWNFIVEEYIRRNKLSMPKNINSKEYSETWHRYESRLKKRMRDASITLEVIIGDEK